MTYTSEALADFLDALNSAMQDRGEIPVDWDVKLTQAAERLRSWHSLDEIETSPARTTDPATSKATAFALTGQNARGKLALVYYRSKVAYGDPGLTAAAATRVARLEHLAAPWKRVSELKQAGIIAPTGRTVKGTRGQQQEELRITDHGIAEVERVFADDLGIGRALGA